MFSVKDREIMRKLAGKVREIAELPEMRERKQRWYNFNALKPDRPMVLCSPEGSWPELLPWESAVCEDERLRQWEWELRSKIYWWEHIHDDNTLEPWFDIGWNVGSTEYGVNAEYTHGDGRGSYHWEPAFKDPERDMDKIHIRKFSVDRGGTFKTIEFANSIFGDILPPRIRGNPACWSMTYTAAQFIGLENLMLYMYDRPELIHRLMAFIRDDYMSMLDWYERENLLTPDNENDYVGSGGVGYTKELPKPDHIEGAPLRLKDIWGFVEAQETVGISPDMFREFIWPYQKPVLERFGLKYYGCCEPVHERIDDIMQVPDIRRVSVSPWCNQEIMAEKLGNKCIFSRKPNPADVCGAFNEEVIRKDISNTLKIAGKGPLEFIMKDTHTVQNEPWRITRWVQLVYEEIGKY